MFYYKRLTLRDVRCWFTEHRHYRHWCHWRTDDPRATGALNHWKHRHWFTGTPMTQRHWSTEKLEALTPMSLRHRRWIYHRSLNHWSTAMYSVIKGETTDFKTSRLQKTPKDYNKRDFKFLKDFQKTSKNFIRLLRLHKNSRDVMRFQETPRNFEGL